jgi:hypothetical protein
MALPKTSAIGHANWAFAAERYTAAQASYGNDALGQTLVASGILIVAAGATPTLTMTLTDGTSLVIDSVVVGMQIPIRHIGVSAVTNVTYIVMFA